MNEVAGLNLDLGPPLKELAFTNLSLRSDCCWLGPDPGQVTGCCWLSQTISHLNTLVFLTEILSPRFHLYSPLARILKAMSWNQEFNNWTGVCQCQLTLFWHHLNASLVIISSTSMWWDLLLVIFDWRPFMEITYYLHICAGMAEI